MKQPRNEGDVIAQRYRVLRTLGQGAFAVAYEAVELETGRHVALKETPLGKAPGRRTRDGLAHEARVLRSLRHPGIPQYVDAFEYETATGVSFFLVHELAQGVSLWEAAARGPRLREAALTALARELLPILDYLHNRERTLVHRDIKPSNVIRSATGRVTLIDFGAAQEDGQDAPSSLSDGTRGYMAPEQIRGRAIPASDLYGLGATLIYLLTGVEPAELPTRGLRLEFREHARVSHEFATWLDSLVQPQVSRRAPTAAAALERLNEIAARVSRRRHRTVRALALAALTVGGMAMVWGAPAFGGSPAQAAETSTSE